MTPRPTDAYAWAGGSFPPNHQFVPDTPPPPTLCWRQSPALVRCVDARFHAGPCTWARRP